VCYYTVVPVSGLMLPTRVRQTLATQPYRKNVLGMYVWIFLRRMYTGVILKNKSINDVTDLLFHCERITLHGYVRSRDNSLSRGPHYGQDAFLISTAFRPVFQPTQSPIQWVLRPLLREIKQAGREADRLPSYSTNVKNAWSYTTTSPYVPWCGAQLIDPGYVI
jgi:hypothetical protein